MKYALFSVPVGTIYDLPQTIKEGVRCELPPAA